ncbi:hypothetical protein LPJ75_002219 [Coemansia sp. RSA 2598]|nr:hypothetical protein LPJ75_002219 [Coemansia sp. RSA 2598]
MHVQKSRSGPQPSGSTPDLCQHSRKPSSQPASPRSPASRTSRHARHYSTSVATTTTSNLYQGFDQDSSIDRPVPSLTPRTNTSLSEMEMRLHRLRSQVAYLQDENQRLSRLSASASSLASQQTLDTTAQTASEESRKVLPFTEVGDDEETRCFDLCRWIRGTGPKTDILYRRHLLSANEPITSPLFRLRRPAAASELLQKYSGFEQPIAHFMDEHRALDPFKPYVLSSAHELPCSPGIAVVNDQATQNLPPLAAEEYMAHVSRLTYLVRMLHHIDIADQVFLSDPRTHMLLDLVLDLEASITLPRIDFLRQHALTIRAMRGGSVDTASSLSSESRGSKAAERPESDYVIGNILDWPPADASAPVEQSPVGADPEHIRHMARAISPHPDFRGSRSEISVRNKCSSVSSRVSEDTGGQILGDKLRPDTEFYAANGIDPPSSQRRSKNPFDPPVPMVETGRSQQRRSRNPFDPPLHAANTSEESVALNGNPAISQFAPSPSSPLPLPVPVERALCKSPDTRCSDPSLSLQFDPKLHPVVGPRSMEVSPTPPLYQMASFSGSTINKPSVPSLHSKGSSGFSQKLRRKAISIPHPLLPSPVSNE